ncbi:MAG: homoserine O-acetyltransferase [Sumerlaeia bacterium]
MPHNLSKNLHKSSVKPELKETQFLQIATPEKPFQLENGKVIKHARLAYQTWGTLNEKKTNAILVFHALTGSHHAAGFDEKGPGNSFWRESVKEGWWDDFIGPDKALDPRRHFIICANYLGGCYGSTGPSDLNPDTGKPYGREFPYPSVSDIVDSQMHLLDYFGIEKLFAVIGGSVGGFMSMDLATRYPERVRTVIPIASSLRATVLSKAMNFEQIFAIAEDANFNGGDYYGGEAPWRGLALARMICHKTFISLNVMEERAQDVIIQPDDLLSGYLLEHKIESYLLHQGKKFVRRFDANSYLRIINAWQSFDLPTKVAGGNAVKTFARCKNQHWVVFSISSDVCFYPNEQQAIVDALKANNVHHIYITAHSDKGHDSFLLEPDLYTPHMKLVLEQTQHDLED